MTTNLSTTIADVIVPEIFTPYTQQLTMEKTAIIQSGVAARDEFIDGLLAGGGLTFTVPSWQDIGDPPENVSSDDANTFSTPNATQASAEVAVRLSRNNSWSTMRLVAALAGADPMQSIAARVSDYWVRRLQRAFVAAAQGVFSTNALVDPTDGRSGQIGLNAAYGAADDLTNDIAATNIGMENSGDVGATFVAGVTNFSGSAFIDTCTLLGDASEDVTAIFVHSIVFSTMQKNNLIDFIPDARGETNIPTFLGRRVIVDDGMPNPAGDSTAGAQTASGVYHSWLVGPSAFRLGVGTPIVPTEVFRYPAQGNGAGSDVLYNRVEWCIHPVGHAFIGANANGGPNNSNLAAAPSFVRVFPERKQIKLARLISCESTATPGIGRADPAGSESGGLWTR